MSPKTSEDSWQRIRTEAGPDLKLFRARFDFMKNPRNGKTERMIILEGNDSANVIAVREGQILFVRQYRFGTNEYTLELPGGLVNDSEPQELAVRRELQEETGYTGKNWHYLGSIGSNPVFMTSQIHHWYTDEIERTHELSLDDGEEIALVSLPIEEVREKLHQGFFKHPHTVNALLRYFYSAHYHPE